MEINLTSVGPSPANGSYGDNFHRQGKPMEVRRLNPITRAWPGPASRPRPLSLAWLPLAQIYHHRRPIIQPLPPARRHQPASTL
jgi:hypothetical protein